MTTKYTGAREAISQTKSGPQKWSWEVIYVIKTYPGSLSTCKVNLYHEEHQEGSCHSGQKGQRRGKLQQGQWHNLNEYIKKESISTLSYLRDQGSLGHLTSKTLTHLHLAFHPFYLSILFSGIKIHRKEFCPLLSPWVSYLVCSMDSLKISWLNGFYW